MTGRLVPLRRVEGLTSELSDEALMGACAQGEPAALGALFDRHHDVTWRFLSRLIGPSDGAVDDLVQATFLEVRRSAGRYARRSGVRTWILGVAANVARHHVRGAGRRHALSLELARLPREPAPPVDEALIRRQLVDRLGVALAALPHDLRVAFVLCDLEETPGVQVALALGVREGTLWRRLHEARRALRAALEDDQ